ncbi:MAG: phospholipase [Planctomycetota bacterium]|nr:MAG: phospholipase [Planctomycetota bacterium]
MLSNVDLSGLHRVHLALKDVRDQLARGPRLVKARDNQLAQSDADKAAKEGELKQTRLLIDRKNLDLKTSEAKLKDLDRKLNEASSNVEFDIFKRQIAADQVSSSVLQDEILELLDKVDRLQKELGEIAERRAKLQADRDQFAQELEAKSVILHQQELEHAVSLTTEEKVIPESIRAHYRRLVDAYGADSLAAIDNGMCSNCHVSLTPQLRVQVEGGTPTFCSSCDRLMYSPK